MINLFLIVSAIIGAILILIILFQKTEGGSLGLGTQTSLTGGMTSNKSSFSGMTKITYALGFGFLFWCLFMGVNVKPGDVIGVREKSKSLVVIADALASSNGEYPWLEWNESKMEGTFLSVPSRDAIPENIKEQLIVELYSK
jgi:preprotein translocase subunit SecG